MDLSKMDPMARKMSLHMDELNKALEADDSASSRFHLNEISKYADFLQDDLTNEIRKSEDTPEPEGVDQFAAGVPVIKFNESGSTFDPAERNRVLKGTIIPSRTNPTMRNVSGTFGRWSQ
jgi:hypothetical protein|tara:strand:- start:830 stop:1189 length:360 start_codon:yes stop_codon:yes gene_type:complete